MKLFILFGQRKESHPGEYGPEVLVCWDEFTVDENPDGFDEACEEVLAKCGSEFYSTQVFEVEVDGEAIRKRLVENPTLDGKIVE